MRKRRMLINAGISLLYQFVVVVCGFVLPRLFLSFYGSSVNGLISSISQFLEFISLLELGVGAVVQSSLYKPLAEKNKIGISKILCSAERFFRKIAFVFAIYTVILMIVYPRITIASFDYWFTFSMIFIIATGAFAQYYFGITNQLLLDADQRVYVQLLIQTGTLVANTILCIALMYFGSGILLVKLVSSFIYILRPLLLAAYVRKHYEIDKKIIFEGEPIKQKWNGLAQHIASVVLNNTDVAVLTILSTLENVSVYSVYYNVVYGVRQVIYSTTSGVQALLGDMYAKKETELLNKTFGAFEWIIHTIVTIGYGCTALLIIPFVKVYTQGITDANYIVPIFGLLMALAQASYCLRLPYNIMVLAAGRYKETQLSAIIEMMINILISIILVFKFGIVGVAAGTLVAMLFRTIYFAFYLSKSILYRDILCFFKQTAIDVVIFLIIYVLGKLILSDVSSYFTWAILAAKVLILGCGASAVINLLFCRKEIIDAKMLIKKRNSKKENE